MRYDYVLFFDMGFIEAAWNDANPALPDTSHPLELAAFRQGYLFGCLPL